MKGFNVLFSAVLVLLASVFIGANLCLSVIDKPEGREYRVQIERAAKDIENTGSFDIEGYPLIVSCNKSNGDNTAFLTGGNSDYAIVEIAGELYRFDYKTESESYKNRIILAVNASLGVMSAIIIAVLILIRIRLLKPFHKLQDMPLELSKGNLSAPLKEEKARYFGRFIWGMDLLRERLEQQKAAELRLQKEKKTLILSIAHDIKTPLSAIKLYAKALSKNLYEDRERQIEIAENINARADDVEAFLMEIVKASNEDFLNLQVENGEFYLSDVIEVISAYYSDKLEYLKIGLEVEPYGNCLIKGDKERSIEVLQNMVENAVKYGNGTAIKIQFSDEEDCKLISVINGGCTLSENETPHIFDSFWRGSNSGSVNGSGLGLYICRQIMNKMDGEIFADMKGDTMTMTAVFRKC